MSVLSQEELDAQLKNEENTKRRLITPIIESRWLNDSDKIVMEYYFTKGRISIDEYNVAHRGKPKKADYLLLYKDNVLLAIVEAKGEDHSADEGYSQAIDYAHLLDVPFAYTTNGHDLIEKDMITGLNKRMLLTDFPTVFVLWDRYVKEKGFSSDEEALICYPYYTTISGKKPRYYQRIAINRAVEHIAKGDMRSLIVMATGTGKTFTAFQIIYRVWQARKMKKILFLADRNILIDQTIRKDFAPFAEAMVKFDNSKIDTSKDIYLSLYHQLKSSTKDFYKDFPRDFFDLIIIDEAHRGSANEDSSWHEILEYFNTAVQIGMTATPKDGGVEEAIKEEQDAFKILEKAKAEDKNIQLISKLRKEWEKTAIKRKKAEESSNITYFGNPIYTYSLRQGIEDGFLAPYKVVSVELDIDRNGYLPPVGMKDVYGNPVDRRLYAQEEFDRKIIVEERREVVAKRITEFMKTNDCRYGKTIVFCESIEHAQEMVRLLENENNDLVAENPKYIMQITGDNDVGKAQLDNFVDPSSKYPVIAVTSKLMSTGVDAETCKLIVLDRSIGSMTEFKQIIGRGTRVKEKYVVDGEEETKMYFTVLDFRKNYLKFNDPEFDGDPVTVVVVDPDKPFTPPPIKPIQSSDYTPPKQKARIARVNGVDVEIINEEVQYLDVNGNLIKQNLDSCVRNNIIAQYPTVEDLKKAWCLTNDKSKFASDLLLDIDWSDSFKIRYGYTVDDFDIIAYFAYDIEPPMSKHQRTQNTAVAQYLMQFDDEKRDILRGLLDAYADTNFVNLKDIRQTFTHSRFDKYGSPLGIIKNFFGTKEKYYDVLKELENKVYE